MKQPGRSWAGGPCTIGGGLSHRHPGDELLWGTSRVLSFLEMMSRRFLVLALLP